MKCTLMNKNTEVLVADYDSALKLFREIIEIKNIDYAPYILKKIYLSQTKEDIRAVLTDWFKGRGIPSWRDKLDLLLYRLGVDRPEELIDKSFGLSLSDQYWIRPDDLDIKYDDINFFEHNFDASDFLEATFTNRTFTVTNESSLKTPNNTTDGMLKKTWIVENGTRYLLKGGYKKEIIQPFNEVLASEICKRLGFDHIEYTIDIVKEKVVSKCACLTTKDTEIIPAYQIMHGDKKNKNITDYENYIKILEDNGILDARIKLENMYILDYLIMNEDRHLNNFGIIRDVNSLKWLNTCPIFDNGQSLNIQDYNEEEVAISRQGRLFYEIKSFDEIIKVVKNIKRIDISKLDDIVEWFDKLLHKYQNITKISDGRINRLCILLNRQVNKLKKLIEDEK